jgi:prefoldin subunit 5
MTFEERIDRLTERHEAMAQSLELLTADVRQVTADVKELTKNQAAMMDAITRLAHIAAIQDERIERLEEGKQ